MEELPQPVRVFLQQHPEFVKVESGKIACVVTGHEMPARIELLEQHLKGKRYKMQKECYSQDFSKYPYIVPSRNSPWKLYCTITHQELNKIPTEVENHVNGAKFQRRLKRAQERAARRGGKVEDAESEEEDSSEHEAVLGRVDFSSEDESETKEPKEPEVQKAEKTNEYRKRDRSASTHSQTESKKRKRK